MRILIAFDADKSDPNKPAVLRGEQKLVAALNAYEVATAEWNIIGGKGLDDLLVNGGTFRRVSRNAKPMPRARVPRPCLEPGSIDDGLSLAAVAAETSVRIGRRFTATYRDTRAIIGPPPGVGKTGLVLRHQEATRWPVLWAVPSHRQGGELVDRAEHEICPCGVARAGCRQHRFLLHHDHGRNADNCPDYAVVEAASQNGYGRVVGQQICGTVKDPVCPFRNNGCDYYPQFERSGAHVAPFETVNGRPDGIGSTKSVVIDDVDSSRFVRRHRIDGATITRAIGSRWPHRMGPLLRVVQAAMATATAEGSFHREAYDLIDDAARHQGTSLEALLADVPGGAGLVPERSAEAYRAAPPGELVEFVGMLHEELPLYLSGKPFTSGVRVHANGIEVFSLNLPTMNAEGRTAYSGRPVTLLTATPDPVARQWLRHLGGEVTREYAPRIAFPARVKVVQDAGAFYGKTTASGTSRATIIQKAKAYLAEFHAQRPAAVTHRSLCDELSSALGIPRERVLHFGNQRGSNALRDADLLLVVGTPAMDQTDAYVLACAAYRGAGEPPSARSIMQPRVYGGWCDARGQGRMVDVLTFVDERVAEIYETARRDELLQAIYRIRPHDVGQPGDWRVQATVVLLTEFPVAGLRVDELRVSGNAATYEASAGRLEAARRLLESSGVTVTSRALAEASGLRVERAQEYLRQVSAVRSYPSIRISIEGWDQAAETLPPPGRHQEQALAHPRPVIERDLVAASVGAPVARTGGLFPPADRCQCDGCAACRGRKGQPCGQAGLNEEQARTGLCRWCAEQWR